MCFWVKKNSIICITLLFLGCAKVPVTGRKQVNLLPESTLTSMSLTNYKQFLAENKVVSASNNDAEMVKRVGDRIAQAVKEYLARNGQSKRIKNYKWEFNLVQDKAVNAWCMPGGKVVVYTGILPITKNEAGLAVVMGHEIAHAIARHGNERMSQQLAVAAGGVGLGVAMRNKPELTQQIFLASYGVGSTLGALKYSRLHESEADRMGLIFMALAGYNPEEAPEFWKRMKATGGAGVPEFLSTHPSHDTRIKDLEKNMPEARNMYKNSQP